MEEANNEVETPAEAVAEAPAERARRLEPASGGRLLLGWGLLLVSVILLFAGWWGVSGQPIVAGQLAYLVSGGVGGLLAGIVGVGLLISNDVRKDRERIGRVEAAVLEIREMLVAQSEEIKRISGGGRGTKPAAPPEGSSNGGTSFQTEKISER